MNPVDDGMRIDSARRQAKVGDSTSALARIAEYAAEFKRCLRRRPDVVILFAEDYDALTTNEITIISRQQKCRLVRGPSVEEYR